MGGAFSADIKSEHKNGTPYTLGFLYFSYSPLVENSDEVRLMALGMA